MLRAGVITESNSASSRGPACTAGRQQVRAWPRHGRTPGCDQTRAVICHHPARVEALPTRLDGPILVQPTVHRDERGFFLESFRRDAFAELGIADDFVQDNHSRSGRGIVRGMHFQIGAGQAKLVQVARGEVVDVLVDIRKGSPTFGEWEVFALNDENLHLVYAPVGFAHGFCVTSEVADVVYKCSNYYDGEIERGIAFNDPDVGIEWPDMELIPSERDANAPFLRDVEDELPFVFQG
jgi:dTDP-4-dehydrorhamnose 3,5-epimerase